MSNECPESIIKYSLKDIQNHFLQIYIKDIFPNDSIKNAEQVYATSHIGQINFGLLKENALSHNKYQETFDICNFSSASETDAICISEAVKSISNIKEDKKEMVENYFKSMNNFDKCYLVKKRLTKYHTHDEIQYDCVGNQSNVVLRMLFKST
jgi:hypothetical protein